jgi:hypothetical protein
MARTWGTDASGFGEAESIESLRHRLEIAELKLKVAELEKEVKGLRERPIYWTTPTWIYWPPYPTHVPYTITSTITSGDTGVCGGTWPPPNTEGK